MKANVYLKIRVVLADDNEIFRDGFQIMMQKNQDIEMIGSAENGAELLKLVAETSPDVIITDIQMPILDGIEATRLLVSKYPEIGVIAFTMFGEESLIVDMLEAGARGYLLKNATRREVCDAITAVFNNETYYCKATNEKLARIVGKSKHKPNRLAEPKVIFSDREKKIIRLICEEKLNKEIADSVNLSLRTIEGYRERIVEKMGVKNTAGIVRYAIKNGLFDL